MTAEALALPMSVLAIWTLSVLGLVPITRVRAVMSGRVKPADFTYGESERVPG